METGKVLFVDDEPAVLEGYRRLLHREIPIDTAVGGIQGLTAIVERGPYAVVVSDIRMPQMNGVQFLARVRKSCPDTVRIALTGYADIETAGKAVNEGNIFRFLTKPCEKETLLQALTAALVQHRIMTAERELLENTLRSSVQVLTEVLSFTNPAAFSKALRLRRYVLHVVAKLKKELPWRFEVAAMLSQLGCITLDSDVLNAVCAGGKLSHDEQARYDAHPLAAWKLLSRIPRMEAIAWMIAQQNGSAPSANLTAPQEKDDAEWGALLLHLLNRYDHLLNREAGHAQALMQLRTKADAPELQVLDAMSDLEVSSVGAEVHTCEILRLVEGMVLQEDIRTTNGALFINTNSGALLDGALIASKGQNLTLPLIVRLHALCQRGTIPMTVRVQYS
jgi:CheY-like chemotaxis protein